MAMNTGNNEIRKTRRAAKPKAQEEISTETIEVSLPRLFLAAILPGVLALLLILLNLKACEHHTDELVTPNPDHVWEEGIRQDRERANENIRSPEWMREE